MKRLTYILMLLMVCTFAYSQSVQKQAFQEIRVDTVRPNHYGPNWHIVFAFHDTIPMTIFPDSVRFKKIVVGANGSVIDSAKVRTDSLSIYSGGIAYNAYKNAPTGGGGVSAYSWWEIDGQGNMMPRASGGNGDLYWELDDKGNLMSKAW